MPNSKQRFHFKSDAESKAQEDFSQTVGCDFVSEEEFKATTADSFQGSLENMLAWIREKKAKADEMPRKAELHQEPTGVTELGSNLKGTLEEESLSEEALANTITNMVNTKASEIPGFTEAELEASQQAVADDILNYMFKLGADGQPLDLEEDIQRTFVNPTFVHNSNLYTPREQEVVNTESEQETVASASDMLVWVREMKAKTKK